LAKTIRQYLDGILAYFDTKLTSGTIEAVNGITQLAKRMGKNLPKPSLSLRIETLEKKGDIPYPWHLPWLERATWCD
jgi:transposase